MSINPTYNHYDMKQKVGVSNLKLLDGEDLTAGDRRKLQQLQMKDWINQQVKDKEEIRRLQKQAQWEYDQQTLNINRIRKELEDDHKNKRVQMEIATQQLNTQQAKEKLDREQYLAKLAEEEKKKHQNEIVNHDLWTENTATCQSQLAPHRVIPYHYKGMSKEQQLAIRGDQAIQRQQNEQKKNQQKEEEKMWAQYNEHNRRQLINLEREKARKLETLKNNTKEFNLLSAEEHGERADDSTSGESNQIVFKFDPHLTKLGHKQAELTGLKIRKIIEETNIQSVSIISSPFLRCIQTTNEIIKQLDRDQYNNVVYISDGLGECLREDWFEKNVYDDLHYYNSKMNLNFKSQQVLHQEVLPQYPESIQTFFGRFSENFNRVKQNIKGPLIIITHGYGIHAINMLEKRMIGQHTDYCSITMIDYQKKKSDFMLVNNTDHLKQLPKF